MHSEPHSPRPSIAVHVGLVVAAIAVLTALVAVAWGPVAGLAVGGVGTAVILAHVAVFGAALLALAVGAHGYGAEGAMGSTLHAARAYDWVVWAFTFGAEARLRKATLDPAELRPGDRVLDVCCGTGTLALAAAERVGDGGGVVGVDAAAEMIERASAKASGHRNVRFQVATAQALPFPDGSFEAVFCSLGLHHVPVHDRAAALREMRRVLVPGGRVVIVEFDRRRASALSPVALLHRRHQPDVLREAATKMAEVGFGKVEVGPLSFAGMGFTRGHRLPSEA